MPQKKSISPKAKIGHKPSGYWKNFANVERELTSFVAEHGSDGSMPSSEELYKTGHSGLATAIQMHGGLLAVAERLGLKRPNAQKPRGYWDDFANVEQTLRVFIAEHGQAGLMPTRRTLQAGGLNGLVSAIGKCGGIFAVAERLGLQCLDSHKPSGYWHDVANLKSELLALISSNGVEGFLPSRGELEKANRPDLVRAIQKHGGPAAVAKRVGLRRSKERKPVGYWNDLANLKSELSIFVASHGTPGTMPTIPELSRQGRVDLRQAIRKHGGMAAVAEKLGLMRPDANKPEGYWQDFANVEKALLAFIGDTGTKGTMPTTSELELAGRADLIVAIGKQGGVSAVAEKLGLNRPEAKRPKGYWEDFTNVESELRAYISGHSTEGNMPTLRELNAAGYSSLAYAINKHGGFLVVADMLGLHRQDLDRPRDYWVDFQNLEKELRQLIEENQLGDKMPGILDLKRTGRFDLIGAINKHGGVFAVAARLGLSPQSNSKPARYWDDFANVERELLEFISNHGPEGVMPYQRELVEAGRNDLAIAISQSGGFAVVANRLKLRFFGHEVFAAPAAASSVERTARAIQPLAESNLLSPAQVMIILRRAGLLEFRNQRVVKLGASLARGDHAEIESAIANLVSDGADLATETSTLEESDDLTAAEAETLLGGGLEASSVPLKQANGPDTDREQAVIRGLSALGELRLPLDEVLSLLTSKVLWQEFYKRLYAWYGSLDAAQTVTASDVEAAILAAYPEHTANEFVAEASALFTLEVEQAVNYAATLANYGWHGPRLRLHQADAARRMAEVLRGDVASPFILNADDPGMGKSASFLAAVMTSDIRTVVLIAPKTVADDTWASAHGEIRRCLPQARIVRGLPAALASLERQHQSATPTFFILHYEELLNEDQIAALSEKSFDCLCLDEIHFIKQRAGQEPTLRRAALETLRASARFAIGLTGTPLVNELAEPMSLLQTLSQNAPRFDHSRLSHRRLRDIADVFEALLPHVVRRRKREVLLHLPNYAVHTVDVPLPGDLEAQMLEIYGWPTAQASHALVELRKLATEAKLPYLLQRAQVARKLLILTYLTDDVSEKIYAYLDDFLPNQIAHINGLVPKAERQTRLDSFRASDGVRVLVGTIGTIGVGLTLFDPKQALTAHEIIIADLPFTWAEFEQGIARLHREGQKQTVQVDVLQTSTAAVLRDGAAQHTLDERLWALIEGKREISNVAIDGQYDTTDAAAKVQTALRRWLKQAREIGVEPLAVERRSDVQSEAQRWRGEIGRLRGMSAARADEAFADPDYTRQFLTHLETSAAGKLSHQWLRGRLIPLVRSDLVVVDMGCGLNPFADLPCHVTGLDRHARPGQLRGKMENPPLPDKSADVIIYSLSLYGPASDLKRYFTHAARILRGGGHLFIVEPDSAFSAEGLKRFVEALHQFGFELVRAVKELRGEDGTLLTAMHLTSTGELSNPPEALFERK